MKTQIASADVRGSLGRLVPTPDGASPGHSRQTDSTLSLRLSSADGLVSISSEIARLDIEDNAIVTLLFQKTAEKLVLQVGKNANVNAVFVPESGTTHREIILAGEGSSYNEQTIIVGNGTDVFTITNKVVNAAPKTTANVVMTGILDGNATASLTGTMRIPFGSRKASSHLTQNMLLTSPDARADVVPNMEIIENDVTAGHAATVRPLDEDSLFYLRSRGFSAHDARQILIQAFIRPSLRGISEDALANITQIIDRRLHHVLLQ